MVKNQKILAKAFDTTRRDRDTTAHAEVNVIRKAVKLLNELSLKGYTLYATGEPCPMCAGAAIWTGLSKIVYGATIPQLMALGHPQINTASAAIIETGLINIEVQAGMLANEVMAMIKSREI